MSTYQYENRSVLWLKYVDAFRWAPGELDHQEFAAFSKAAFYGIEQNFAFNYVVDKMKHCGARNLRLSKIRHSLARAYATGGDGPCRSAPPLKLPHIRAYDEELLRNLKGEQGNQAGGWVVGSKV